MQTIGSSKLTLKKWFKKEIGSERHHSYLCSNKLFFTS
jgi:hypothetical protein